MVVQEMVNVQLDDVNVIRDLDPKTVLLVRHKGNPFHNSFLLSPAELGSLRLPGIYPISTIRLFSEAKKRMLELPKKTFQPLATRNL